MRPRASSTALGLALCLGSAVAVASPATSREASKQGSAGSRAFGKRGHGSLIGSHAASSQAPGAAPTLGSLTASASATTVESATSLAAVPGFGRRDNRSLLESRAASSKPASAAPPAPLEPHAWLHERIRMRMRSRPTVAHNNPIKRAIANAERVAIARAKTFPRDRGPEWQAERAVVGIYAMSALREAVPKGLRLDGYRSFSRDEVRALGTELQSRDPSLSRHQADSAATAILIVRSAVGRP